MRLSITSTKSRGGEKLIGPSKKEAEKALRALMGQVDRGEYRELEEITFGELAKKYLKYIKSRRKPNTYIYYKFIIEPYLIPRFGDFELTQITPDMVELYLSEIAEKGKLSARTLNHHLLTLKLLFKKAIVWGNLRQNPAKDIENFKIERKEMEFLSPGELKSFLSQVSSEFYPIFAAAILTGMRRGEILDLKWGDINWIDNRIHVRRSLGPKQELGDTKTKTSMRTIGITPKLASILRKHQLASESNQHDLVFANSFGNPWNANDRIAEELKRALRKAGLRKIRFHDLRHSYVAMLIAQGENVKFIQHQLGHASIKTTLDKYGHLLPEIHTEAAKRIDATLFGTTSDNIVRESISNTLAESNQQNKDNGFVAGKR